MRSRRRKFVKSLGLVLGLLAVGAVLGVSVDRFILSGEQLPLFGGSKINSIALNPQPLPPGVTIIRPGPATAIIPESACDWDRQALKGWGEAIAQLQTQVQKLQQDAADMQTKIDEVKVWLKGTNDMIKLASDYLTELQAKIQRVLNGQEQGDLTQLNNEYKQEEAKLKSLQTTAQQEQDFITTAEKSIQRDQGEIQSLQNKIASLQDSYDKVKAQLPKDCVPPGGWHTVQNP